MILIPNISTAHIGHLCVFCRNLSPRSQTASQFFLRASARARYLHGGRARTHQAASPAASHDSPRGHDPSLFSRALNKSASPGHSVQTSRHNVDLSALGQKATTKTRSSAPNRPGADQTQRQWQLSKTKEGPKIVFTTSGGRNPERNATKTVATDGSSYTRSSRHGQNGQSMSSRSDMLSSMRQESSGKQDASNAIPAKVGPLPGQLNTPERTEKRVKANRPSALPLQRTKSSHEIPNGPKPASMKQAAIKFPSFATSKPVAEEPSTKPAEVKFSTQEHSEQPAYTPAELVERRLLASRQVFTSPVNQSGTSLAEGSTSQQTSHDADVPHIEPSVHAHWRILKKPNAKSASPNMLSFDHPRTKIKAQEVGIIKEKDDTDARFNQHKERRWAEKKLRLAKVSPSPDIRRFDSQNSASHAPRPRNLEVNSSTSTPAVKASREVPKDKDKRFVDTSRSQDDSATTHEDEFKPRHRNRRDELDLGQVQETEHKSDRFNRRMRARSKRRDDDLEEADDDSRPSRRREKLELEDGTDPDLARMLTQREQRKRAKQDKKQEEARRAAERRLQRAERMAPIRIPDFVTTTRLAQMLNISYAKLEKTMSRLGFTSTSPDHILSAENAGLAAIEHNFDPSAVDETESRDLHAREMPTDKSMLQPRPPVVAIMGHVDHGKTTLLDYLRKTSVAATEHGGITQHIGAFSVELSSTGKTITFLDTPGHSAFLAMRQRGAIVTDIIVLVVAADDSVKPQTLEALKHAKEASVPIIVAINKIDKPEADIQRVKNDLARHGVEIEEFGGDAQVICVSGKTGEGMEELEEAAVTLSEILDHRADPDGAVEGWIIEATTKLSGRAATVLVRHGTLRVGDIIVAGQTWARVRVLRNEAGQTIDAATPGMPVEVEGWRDQPVAGDEVLAAPSEQKAADVVHYRAEVSGRVRLNDDVEAVNKARQLEMEKRIAQETTKDRTGQSSSHPSSTSASEAAAEVPTTVPFIIKADVSGSAEAVNDYLLQMTNPICSPTVLRSGVGPVTEFDIEHAAVAQGHILAFNLTRDAQSTLQAERRGVKILYQDVIYRIVADVKEVLEGKLPPVVTQRVVGEAEIASTFEISLGGRKKMAVAGCKIRNGLISRKHKVRVLREETKVYDGAITSLKNVKKDVNEMRKGSECGLAFEKWEDFKPGDTIQTYEEKSEPRTLPI